MIKTGDRVRHQTRDSTFGLGTVLNVNGPAGSALVEWETHQVARETAELSARQTHVSLTSLVVVPH